MYAARIYYCFGPSGLLSVLSRRRKSHPTSLMLWWSACGTVQLTRQTSKKSPDNANIPERTIEQFCAVLTMFTVPQLSLSGHRQGVLFDETFHVYHCLPQTTKKTTVDSHTWVPISITFNDVTGQIFIFHYWQMWAHSPIVNCINCWFCCRASYRSFLAAFSTKYSALYCLFETLVQKYQDRGI